VSTFDDLVDDALRLFWSLNPVTASFAGETAYDTELPTAVVSEPTTLEALERLATRLDATEVPDDIGARLDARYIRAFREASLAPVAQGRLASDPVRYTSETTFGVIALLLREDPNTVPALRSRLAKIADFLDHGRAVLAGAPMPKPWANRAATEAAAFATLLRSGLPKHPWARVLSSGETAPAIAAAERFARALSAHEDADPACGVDHLGFVMRQIHGLEETPQSLERRAASALEDARDALEEAARRVDPTRTWQEIVARAAAEKPAPATTLAVLQTWHERALVAAEPLITPARDYRLSFEALPAWAAEVASDLYFLFYRSPAARFPGSGSTYWSVGDPSVSDAKLVHAVHHGSIGHHTQNARARVARSRFARIAGTDGAAALALPGSGTMVEGWACYAEDLLEEVPGFYTQTERVLLRYFTLQNIACCLADVRLHSGRWTLEEVQRFYTDDVAFAPGRVVLETVRNSLFPGSRLMYWVGTSAIAELRRRSLLGTRAFHDELLAFGSVPVAWIRDEIAS